jgi:hypothetical protein
MPVTLQLEEVAIIPLHDAPQLLVEWSPRWEGFVTSIGPAFARSGGRLAGEAPDTLMPYRGMLKSFSLQFLVLFVLIVLPHQIDRLRPYAAPKVQSYDVIYYSGDELPRTEDLGGAQSGATGRAGGREAHHATQTIRVARGGSLKQTVVDAPNIKLPPSKLDVANFLAVKANPGPPPAEGLHSSLATPSLPANVIAPAQVNVSRDHSRGGVTLDAIVPPAPSISSDKSRTTPTLSAAVVPPAPNVQSEHTLYAPRLDSSIIATAPNVSRDRIQAAPSLNPNVIGPAATRVSRDRARSTPTLNASVIPPAPATPGREVARSRVQMNEIGVVPPPVSAPEREVGRNAKLNLPVPSVIAPPPSTDSAHHLRRLESGGSGSASPNVIPPPPTQTANTGLLSSIVGKLFGTQDVVPPPPSVSAGSASGTGRSAPGASTSRDAWDERDPSAAIRRRFRCGPGFDIGLGKFRQIRQWHGSGRQCYSAASIGWWRLSAVWLRLGQKRRGPRRSRRRRFSSRSSERRTWKQRQWRSRNLFATRLESRTAGQRWQRLIGDVALRRRQAGRGRVWRRR